MKTIKYKNRLNLNCGIIWFCKNIKNIEKNLDVVELNGYPYKIKNAKKQLSLTLNLELPEDEIFNEIKKNVKYEINRCYKEDVQATIYNSKELSNDNAELQRFKETYNKMYEEKNLPTRLDLKLVQKYIDNNIFYLTKSHFNEKTLSYHAYLSDENETRLLYSCSTFRSEKEESALIARANKFLHWEDIKYFKKLGVKIYDFGGLSSFENPNGIDKFKMAFGGEKIEYYNITFGRNLKGKLFVFANKIKNILRRKH